jgi:hypothetical protein
MDQNKLPLERRYLRVPSGPSQTITEPMVLLVQTMQLSCTVSKQTETTFDMTHAPRGFHRVRPK